MVIGITGKIGAGKSVVSNYIISKYNYDYINEDEVAHRLFSDNLVKEAILKEFGKDVFNDKNLIDRNLLKNKLNKKNIINLNNIIHPLVFDYVKEYINNHEKNIIIETALPTKARLGELCDLIFVIERDYNKRKEAVLEERKNNSNFFEFINSIQNTEINFENKYILKNNGNLEELFKKIDGILNNN